MKIFTYSLKYFIFLFSAAHFCFITQANISYAQSSDSDPIIQQILDENLLTSGGLSAAVLFPDGTVRAAANGIADIGETANPVIPFGTADFSQHLLAVLTLRLVEEGTISLSDQVGEGIIAGANATVIPPNATIEQLLNHTSGINDFTSASNYLDPGTSIIFTDLTINWSVPNYAPIIASFLSPLGPAGTAGNFQYSPTNYLILGEVLEGITGESLQSLLETFILIPSGLSGLAFFLDDPQPDSTSTLFFNISGILPEALSAQSSILTSTGGAGSLVATPTAIATYMNALFSGDILSEASVSLLLDFSDISGRLSNAYGLGTERFNLDINGEMVEFIGHTGDINYSSAFIYSPTLQRGSYVTSNLNGISDTFVLSIAQQLIEATSGNLAPTAIFSASPTQATAPAEIFFDATASSDADGNIQSFEWDFGDGTTGAGDTISHIYDIGGSYTVVLTITDDQGLTSQQSEVLNINSAPQASFVATPTEGSAPLTVTFDASASLDSDGEIVVYEWDFGDGSDTSDIAPVISHEYSTDSTFTVTLNILDNNGASDTASLTLFIGTSVSIDPAIASPFELVLFPNPVSTRQELIVNFMLLKPGIAEIRLLSTLGQELISISTGPLPEGENVIPINLDNVSKGTYFFQIEMGGQSETKQITIYE